MALCVKCELRPRIDSRKGAPHKFCVPCNAAVHHKPARRRRIKRPSIRKPKVRAYAYTRYHSLEYVAQRLGISTDRETLRQRLIHGKFPVRTTKVYVPLVDARGTKKVVRQHVVFKEVWNRYVAQIEMGLVPKPRNWSSPDTETVKVD